MSDKRTPADEKSSTHRDLAAQEPREKFVIEFGRVMAASARKCFDGDVLARGELASAASLRTKFDELPTTRQKTVVDSVVQLRRNLTKAFDDWCATFQTQLCDFAYDLWEVAPDPLWIAEELADTCSYELELKGQSYHWLAIACSNELWHMKWPFPGWLLGWPDDVPSSELAFAVLSGRRFLLTAFGTRFCESIDLAQTAAQHRTLNLISSEDKVRPAQIKNRSLIGADVAIRRDEVSKRLAELMRCYPSWTHRNILGKYDLEDRVVREQWKKHGHREMVSAYDCLKCQRSVERFMSRIRRRLGLPRAPKSSRP